jgi:dTDP-4-amino-4,6-dideoxygalactose transaminase
MRNVPFFNYPAMFSERENAYLESIETNLRKGAFIMQQELADFEANLSGYLGCRHAIGVADGTAALEMSLAAAGLQRGDEVILSSHTFIATAAAVHHLGGVPVVADCLPDSMIDPVSVERLITGKTRFVMPTQLNGRTCDMSAIMFIAKTHSLKVVEDSCQALGASYGGTKAGLFGIAGSYSFYPAKTLGCFGDGGAVVTNDDETAATIRQIRDHGRRTSDGKVTMFGRNGRLDNIQAAILDIKLKHYDEAIARRRTIADIYQDALGHLSELVLPPASSLDDKRFDIFQNYEIQAENRDGLREHLSEQGVGTILQWGGWMLHQFDDLGLRSDAPYAEELSKRFMMLPMHHMLSDDDAAFVCDQVLAFYRKVR